MPLEPRNPSDDPTRIAHLLNHIRVHASATEMSLAHTTGVELGYIHDVLAGRRFPTRSFTHRYARACGADPQVLLMVWQDERARRQRPRP
ncbi:helix-turn-helix domain-containing protein [Streptomyces xanthochromogenes]|uniref:helix-turn-helix domain-containing protein n=1 Tax=Streptomyces xanthochromogenes TaxID=67384 RepID=UPI0034329ED8